MKTVFVNGNGIPETGEWVLSPQPNCYVVVLNNDTGLFHGIERLALGCQAERTEGDNTLIRVTSIHSVDGILPGVELDISDESKEFCRLVEPRIEPALEQWATETDQLTREAVWAM